MGWTEMQKPRDIEVEIKRMHQPHLVLGGRKVGSIWFVACNTDGTTWLSVVLTSEYKGLWRYKALSEWQGISRQYAKCPNSILDLLSSTDDVDALAFREASRVYNNRPKPEVGQTVRMPEPIAFAKGAYCEFTRVQHSRYRNVYRTETGALVRLKTTDFVGGEIINGR